MLANYVFSYETMKTRTCKKLQILQQIVEE